MFTQAEPSDKAIITANGSFSYSDFYSGVISYTDDFAGKQPKMVAVWGENSADWIFAFFASWKIGAIVVPIDYMASTEDVAYILNDCRPGIVFVGKDVTQKIDELGSLLKFTPSLIALGERKKNASSAFSLEIEEQTDRTAVIIYTSGTTGDPKGVMLSFGNLRANVNAVSAAQIFCLHTQTLMLLPLHHVFPLVGSMIAPLWTGGTIVMSPSMQPSDLLAVLGKNSVEVMIGVPRFYEMLQKGIESKIVASVTGRLMFRMVMRLKSKWLAKHVFKKVHVSFGGKLRYLVAGGAKLELETGAFFDALGFEVLEGFGMTEAAPMISFPRPGTQKLGTVGQALPGSEIAIRDGEIVAKGPQIMQAYYNRPAETAEVLRDGWLYTGDYGTLDKDGYLTITGRKKEIIVLSNGKNINPLELERELLCFDGVNDIGIILHNNSLHAIIVPDSVVFNGKSPQSVEEFLKNKVLAEFNRSKSSYKRITQLSVSCSDLPRTRLGKIQRYKLSSMIVELGEEVSEIPDEGGEFKVIRGYLETIVPKRVQPQHSLDFDLALDSLGKLGLADFLKKTFGLQIENDNLSVFGSVGEIVEYVKQHKTQHLTEVIDWTKSLKSKSQLSIPKTWMSLLLLKKLGNWAVRLYFKYRWSGLKNVPEGPCIIAPNHQSFFDGLFVASLFRSKQMRQTYFYAKKKHVKGRFVEFLAKRNNVIVMDLNNDLHLSVQMLAEVLKRGKKLIIFPEGTRSYTGEVGDFKKMFAILSKELDVPVVPVAIKGAFNALPRGSFVPKLFARVNVSFLEPVYPADSSVDAIVRRVKEEIIREVHFDK